MNIYRWDASLEIYQAWVSGYEGLYVADWESGSIISVDRIERFKRGEKEVTRKRGGRTLKTSFDNKTNTLYVLLFKGGEHKYHSVAELMAKSFDLVPEKPTNKDLSHRDGDPHNCAGHNLVWTDFND